jgi:hypothetical protein
MDLLWIFASSFNFLCNVSGIFLINKDAIYNSYNILL